MTIDDRNEWLEADGLGGFASGTTSGIRTRRYHALLLTATNPPTGRMVLVNGFDAQIEMAGASFALSSQRYAPGVVHPDGASRIVNFTTDPWPTWVYRLSDRVHVTQEILVEHGTGTVLVRWSVKTDADVSLRLSVGPFLSGRDYHSMHRENGACRFDVHRAGGAMIFQPYSDVPAVRFFSNGAYTHAPDWYRNFLYSAERERGLDDREDLAAPGIFEWTLDSSHAEAVLLVNAQHRAVDSNPGDNVAWSATDVAARAAQISTAERARRTAFPSRLDRAADAYLVQRGRGRTIVAGYPWFTDWGRDTFIAMRGLCLATGRLKDARDILVAWAGAVSEGMLPNRFPDHGEAPEFNSVDASLWYVIAADELLRQARSQPSVVSAADRRTLEAAVAQIVAGYASGTRYGIRMDTDGLLSAGVPGVQLTWMDARVGDRVITPRIGKPVEIQALWLNALVVAARSDARWRSVFDIARAAFADRFWIEERGWLADVVDVDHVQGTCDPVLRPNQILAVGGLPFSIVDGNRAERIVAVIESKLWTPLGLRSLAPDEPGYAPRYEGDGAARDAVYHQGTVWPWLMGAFIDAWVRVSGGTARVRADARRRFVEPLLRHLDEAGIGHVSEIADAEPPFTPRGCPFQAWSLGELLRVDRSLLRRKRNPVSSRRFAVPETRN